MTFERQIETLGGESM